MKLKIDLDNRRKSIYDFINDCVNPKWPQYERSIAAIAVKRQVDKLLAEIKELTEARDNLSNSVGEYIDRTDADSWEILQLRARIEELDLLVANNQARREEIEKLHGDKLAALMTIQSGCEKYLGNDYDGRLGDLLAQSCLDITRTALSK